MHWSNPLGQTTSGAGLRCIAAEAIDKRLSIKEKQHRTSAVVHNHKRAMEMQYSSLS